MHSSSSIGRRSLGSGNGGIQSRPSPPPNQTLHGSPALLNNRRDVGSINVNVDFFRDLDDGLPGERRLEESHADEMSVEDGREERVAEHESAKDDASENENFSIRHYLHCGVVVGWAK